MLNFIEWINENIDIHHKYGYHAGNLAHKSGTLSRNNYMKTLRSQLGTGFFFFGNIDDALKLAEIKINNIQRKDMLAGTSVYRVDFTKYNLLKPDNAIEFYDNLIIPMVRALNDLNSNDIFNKDIIEGLIDLVDYYRSFGVTINNKDFIKIIHQYLIDMERGQSKSDEVINTRILKHAGFEGVDLRGTEKDGVINGKAGVGSVIFDLKPNTLSKLT